MSIISIESCHGGEFEKKNFSSENYGIIHNFSTPKMPN